MQPSSLPLLELSALCLCGGVKTHHLACVNWLIGGLTVETGLACVNWLIGGLTVETG